MFILNPYDLYVVNNMVNGHQMKVAWYVNNSKVSHKDPFETTMFAAYLDSIYREKPKVRRGEAHGYLGMDMD